MIRYALACREGHAFESWFRNSADFDSQAERKLVTCPVCGTDAVEKALMTPRLGHSAKNGPLLPPELFSPAAVPAGPASAGPGGGVPGGGVPGVPPAMVQQVAPARASAPAPAGPNPALSDAVSPDPLSIVSTQEMELRRKLRELRDHLLKNAEHVGARFPEEARKMHYGETEHRSIYGEATREEVEEMLEEGVEFHPLPALPDDRN